MRHFTAADARMVCLPRGMLADFRGYGEIDPEAVDEIVAFLRRSRELESVLIHEDDCISGHVSALQRLLSEKKATFSIMLSGGGRPPFGIGEVLAATDVSLFADSNMLFDDPAFFDAIGSQQRAAVTLRVAPDCSLRLLRPLRAVERLELVGLRFLDAACAKALLRESCINELFLPDLTHLTREAALVLSEKGLTTLAVGPALQHSPASFECLQTRGVLQLHGIARLSEAEAEVLSRGVPRCLVFNDSVEMDRGAASMLARFRGILSLGDQRSISREFAEGLTNWMGSLVINTEQLDAQAAVLLGTDRGDLDLTVGISEGPVDQAAIASLAKTGFRHRLRLSVFNRDCPISVDTAAALASHPGQLHLSVHAVEPEACEFLARLDGELEVNDAIELDLRTADYFSSHRGPLALNLKEMPEAAAIRVLREHKGRSLTLKLPPGDASISVDVAIELASYRGLLRLFNVETMDAGSVRALSVRHADLEVVSHDFSAEMEAAIVELHAAGALVRERASGFYF